MSNEATEKYVTWNSDIDYALGYSKIFNQLLGIWPYEYQSLFSKIRVIIVLISQMMLSMHCIREIRGSCMEPHYVTNFAVIISACLLSTIKIAVLRANQDRMELVITSITEDWIREEHPKSQKIMRRYASIGRTMFIYEMFMVFIVLVLLGLIPLWNMANDGIATDSSSSVTSTAEPAVLSNISARTLPMGTGCFVADLPTILYAMFYVFQMVQIMITAVANIGSDVFFLCLTFHVCGQFELLKERLEKLGSEKDIPSCREELGKVVRRYNHLMTLATYFEHIFGPIIFGILAVDTICINFFGLGVLISIKEGEVVRVIYGICCIYTVSLQLLIYCYAGEQLSSQDETIRKAAYNCRWYDLPPTIIRDIVFIITKSGFEFQLTAGKVFQMNMNNFKMIMKTLVSYFSMLRIMLTM